jgi:hypothetical protein
MLKFVSKLIIGKVFGINKIHQDWLVKFFHAFLLGSLSVSRTRLFFISECGFRIAESIDFQSVAFLEPAKCWVPNSTKSIRVTIFFETKRYGEMWILESIDFQ